MGDTLDDTAHDEHAVRHEPAHSEKSDRAADKARDDNSRSGNEKSGRSGHDDDQQPARRWPLVVLGIVVVLAIIGGVAYWLLTRNLESTDDAYTDGNAIAYAAKVSGYVTRLNVSDNTFVHAGDLLLTIDPRDYTTARDQARANLSLARAHNWAVSGTACSNGTENRYLQYNGNLPPGGGGGFLSYLLA